MKILSRLSGIALLLFGLCWPAMAQIGPGGSGALVVAVCGTLPLAYKAGATVAITQDVNGNLCSSASGGGGGGAITAASGSYASGALASGSLASGSMVDLLTFQGTKAAGTAAANSLLAGLIYNSSPITLTTGQQAAIQGDANGFLKVNIAAGGTVGIAQGATYSAQTFTPVMGLASTNAPTATNGDLWGLSISPASGGVRIDLKDTASNTNSFLVNLASGGVASGAIASGAVASGAVASGAYASGAFASGSGADGWNVTLGAKADSVCATATGTCTEQALLKYLNTQLASLVSGLLTPPIQTINGGSTYNTVAASQSTQALTGGSGGATGDYLSHCVILPTTTSAGTVTIFDNTTAIFVFTTGTLSSLVPFTIPVGAVSVSGAWKVTTGAAETVTCVGKFH